MFCLNLYIDNSTIQFSLCEINALKKFVLFIARFESISRFLNWCIGVKYLSLQLVSQQNSIQFKWTRRHTKEKEIPPARAVGVVNKHLALIWCTNSLLLPMMVNRVDLCSVVALESAPVSWVLMCSAAAAAVAMIEHQPAKMLKLLASYSYPVAPLP